MPLRGWDCALLRRAASFPMAWQTPWGQGTGPSQPVWSSSQRAPGDPVPRTACVQPNPLLWAWRVDVEAVLHACWSRRPLPKTGDARRRVGRWCPQWPNVIPASGASRQSSVGGHLCCLPTAIAARAARAQRSPVGGPPGTVRIQPGLTSLCQERGSWSACPGRRQQLHPPPLEGRGYP